LPSTTIYPSQDARVDQSHPSNNYGTESTLEVRSYRMKFLNEYYYYNQRSYLQFNLNLPTGSSVSSASLYLYAIDQTSWTGNIYCYKTASTFNENDITWNNQPDITGSPTTFSWSSTVNEWKCGDVTPLVQDTPVNGTLSLRLRKDIENSSTDRWMKFYSKEEASYKPYLVINYTTQELETVSRIRTFLHTERVFAERLFKGISKITEFIISSFEENEDLLVLTDFRRRSSSLFFSIREKLFNVLTSVFLLLSSVWRSTIFKHLLREKVFNVRSLKYILGIILTVPLRTLHSLRVNVNNFSSFMWRNIQQLYKLFSSIFGIKEEVARIFRKIFGVLNLRSRLNTSLFLLKNITSSLIRSGYLLRSFRQQMIRFFYLLKNTSYNVLLLSYSSLYRILQTLSSVYTLIGLVRNFVHFFYTALEVKSMELRSFFGVLTKTLRLLSMKFSLLVRRIRVLSLQSSLQVLVQEIFGLIHTIRERLFSTLSIFFSLLEKITQDLRSLYSLLGRISNTKILLSSIKIIRTGLLSLKYLSRVLISNFNTFFFSIIGSVYRSLRNIYNVGFVVVRSIISMFSLISRRTMVLLLDYSLKHLVSSMLKLVNSLRSLLLRSNALLFSLKNLRSLFLRSRFSLQELKGVLIRYYFNIQQRVYRLISNIYNVLVMGVVSALMSSSYLLRSLITGTFRQTYFIKVKISKLFRSMYSLLKLVRIKILFIWQIGLVRVRQMISLYSSSAIVKMLLSGIYSVRTLLHSMFVTIWSSYKLIMKLLKVLHSLTGVVVRSLRSVFAVVPAYLEVLTILIRQLPTMLLIKTSNVLSLIRHPSQAVNKVEDKVGLIKDKTIQILKKVIRRQIK